MTQEQKAEAVLAAFRDEAACENCGETVPRASLELQEWRSVIGAMRRLVCKACDCCTNCLMRRRGISEMRCNKEWARGLR